MKMYKIIAIDENGTTIENSTLIDDLERVEIIAESMNYGEFTNVEVVEVEI